MTTEQIYGIMLPLMEKITERQKRVLGQIWAHRRSSGAYPTYTELMERLGLKSKQSVADFLGSLEARGYITRYFGKRRGIRLTEEAIQLLVDDAVSSQGIEFSPEFSYYPFASNKGLDSTSFSDMGDAKEDYDLEASRMFKAGISQSLSKTITSQIEGRDYKVSSDYPSETTIGDKTPEEASVFNINGDLNLIVANSKSTNYRFDFLLGLKLKLGAIFDKLFRIGGV